MSDSPRKRVRSLVRSLSQSLVSLDITKVRKDLAEVAPDSSSPLCSVASEDEPYVNFEAPPPPACETSKKSEPRNTQYRARTKPFKPSLKRKGSKRLSVILDEPEREHEESESTNDEQDEPPKLYRLPDIELTLIPTDTTITSTTTSTTTTSSVLTNEPSKILVGSPAIIQNVDTKELITQIYLMHQEMDLTVQKHRKKSKEEEKKFFETCSKLLDTVKETKTEQLKTQLKYAKKDNKRLKEENEKQKTEIRELRAILRTTLTDSVQASVPVLSIFNSHGSLRYPETEDFRVSLPKRNLNEKRKGRNSPRSEVKTSSTNAKLNQRRNTKNLMSSGI